MTCASPYASSRPAPAKSRSPSRRTPQRARWPLSRRTWPPPSPQASRSASRHDRNNRMVRAQHGCGEPADGVPRLQRVDRGVQRHLRNLPRDHPRPHRDRGAVPRRRAGRGRGSGMRADRGGHTGDRRDQADHFDLVRRHGQRHGRDRARGRCAARARRHQDPRRRHRHISRRNRKADRPRDDRQESGHRPGDIGVSRRELAEDGGRADPQRAVLDTLDLLR